MQNKSSPRDEDEGNSIDDLLDDDSYMVQRRHNIYSHKPNRDSSKSTAHASLAADTKHIASGDKNADEKDVVRRDKAVSLTNVLRKDLEAIGESFAREHDASDQFDQPGNHRPSVKVSLDKQKSLGAHASFVEEAKSEKPVRQFRSFVDSGAQTTKAKGQRKASFGSGNQSEPKEEASGLLYDYILHHSELASASKVKGKILVNSYMEMDGLKSDNVSHYLKTLKDLIAGKTAENVEKPMPKIPEEKESAKKEDSGSENNSQNEHYFNSEESDHGNGKENIEDLIENYQEEEGEYQEEEKEQKEEKNNVEGVLIPHSHDNNEQESRELAPRDMFMKFNGKENVQKKAKKLKPSQPIVFRKPAKVIEPEKPVKPIEPAPKVDQIHNEPVRTESQPKREENKQEEPNVASISENNPVEQNGSLEPDQVNRQDDIIETPLDLIKESSAPVGIEHHPKEEASTKSLTDLPQEVEDWSKKSTIRVLSKFDTESNSKGSTGLTLEKVIAKNTAKGRDRGRSIETNNVPKQATQTPDSLKTSDPNFKRNITRISVPEDPLDTFDTQDETELEVSVNTNVADSLVVTQNPLFSSYKLKMTDITVCKTLSQTFCDSSTSKKAHEPTVIKFAPPDYIFVGTNLSTVLVYDSQENLKQTIKYNEGPKQAVTALDYSLEDPELHILVVGFSGGHIAIYDLKNFNCLKTITDVQTSKISCIKIYQGYSPIKKFISCDESGEIFSFSVQKVLWLYKETHNLILKDNDTFTFDVEVIPKDIRILNSHSLQDQEYLRNIWFLAKFDSVIVMNVNRDTENNYVNLSEWTFERPPNVGPECLPSISIGKGGLVDNKKKSYLLIGWGQFLNLINFSFNGFKITFAFEGYFELEGNILVSAWIADDTAVAIDDKNMVYFVNIEEFIGLKTLENNSEGNSDDTSKKAEKPYMYKFKLDKGLKTSVSYINNKRIHSKPFKNAVSLSSVHHQMFMTCEDKVSKMKIVSALEYLDLLLNDNEWLKFLTIGLQMYHHNLKEFHGVPHDVERRKQLFDPFFQERISKYVDENLKAGARSERYYKEFILSLIDFLIELDDTQLLFGYCNKKICEAGLQKLFIELLEPFIILNKITYVPDDLLKTIITHYCLQGKSRLMQKLIANLDLSRQDCFILIHLCLEHNLYTALISVCANTEQDFLTPFVKQINDYRSAKHNKNDEEAQKYGYRCLWYLRLCIEKRIVSGDDEESFEKWKKIMNQLMVMVFEPENLKILFETDGDLTTCFVMLFFIGDLAALVEESYGSMKFGNTKQGDSASDNVHFQIYATVKQVFNNWAGPEKKTLYIQYFGFFLGILAHLMRYSFLDRDLCVYFADLYISQPTLLSEKLLLLWEKTRLRKEGKTSQEIRNYFKEKIDYDFIFEQRVGVILDLLKYCQFALTKDQINELIKKAQASHLIDVECFLLAISWDYKGCFNIYLTHQGAIESHAKLFDWTNQTIKQYYEKTEKTQAEKKAIEELKVAIINKMPTLIALDGDRTITLIETYLSDKILHVLNNLEFRPDLKLKILEKYMRKQEENFAFDEKLLILYIKLLAQADRQQRKKIKSIIQSSNKYPIAECLDICRKYDVKDVWAYLEVKQGKIENAINISYELLEDNLEEIFINENLYNRDEIGEALNSLIEYLNQNGSHPEETWLQNLIKVYKFFEENVSKVHRADMKEEFLSFRTLIMDQLTEDILKNFDSRSLMRTIESLYHDFPTKLRRNMISKIISHNVHEQFVLNYCKTLLCEDILNFININLLPVQLRGNYHLPCCETCQRGFRTYEYIIWFGCGHLYHSSETCCPGYCVVCHISGSSQVLNIVHQKISRGSKTQTPKSIKLPVEEDVPDLARHRAVTRSFKENQDQYYNEKTDKLNKYWKNKTQKQSELNDFTEKYL